MQKNFSKLLIVGFIVLAQALAWADAPTFENLSKDDFQGIVRDFSAVFAPTSVSPASSLGKVFGFEIGMVAGTAKTPKVEELAKEEDPNSDITMLPHAGLLGVLSFPLGFTGEIVMTPEVDASDVTLKSTSIAVKWTFTDILPLPLDMSIKAHATNSEMDFSGDVNGVATTFAYENKITGLLFQGSKKLTIFEPYFGVGVVKSVGSMAVTGSTQVYDNTYTGGQKAEETITGGQYLVGANFNLLFVKFGIEAGRIFKAGKASAKVSLYF